MKDSFDTVIFNCILCEKSFLSKHNLKVNDKRFHTKQDQRGHINVRIATLIALKK